MDEKHEDAMKPRMIGVTDRAYALGLVSDAKHSPGPWRNDYMPSTGFGAGYGRSQIIDSKGNALAGVAITEATYKDGEFDQATLDRLEANAALIAAAPDLLEACRMIVAAYGEDLVGPEIIFLRAALANATGEQP